MPPVDTTALADRYRAHLTQRLVQSVVPAGLHDGLIEYIATRRPTGQFLRAVLSNDLKEACGRIDVENRPFLYQIVFFLYNYAPGDCWGSPANVDAWLSDASEPPMVSE